MKSAYLPIILLVCLAVVCTSCAKKDTAPKTAEKAEPIGIVYKEGKGLRIAEETRKIINLELVEASDQNLAAVLSTTVLVYRTGDSNNPVAFLTGFVTSEQASELKEGQSVRLERLGTPGNKVMGRLERLNTSTQPVLNQVEVLIQIPDPESRYKIGTSFEATFTAAKPQMVTAIPRSAVLKTTEGTFVYVVNGNYFFRTAIKTGAESTDFVEVKEGLYAGDQIVKQPVMTLWVAELQAIKGGADND